MQISLELELDNLFCFPPWTPNANIDNYPTQLHCSAILRAVFVHQVKEWKHRRLDIKEFPEKIPGLGRPPLYASHHLDPASLSSRSRLSRIASIIQHRCIGKCSPPDPPALSKHLRGVFCIKQQYLVLDKQVRHNNDKPNSTIEVVLEIKLQPPQCLSLSISPTRI